MVHEPWSVADRRLRERHHTPHAHTETDTHASANVSSKHASRSSLSNPRGECPPTCWCNGCLRTGFCVCCVLRTLAFVFGSVSIGRERDWAGAPAFAAQQHCQWQRPGSPGSKDHAPQPHAHRMIRHCLAHLVAHGDDCGLNRRFSAQAREQTLRPATALFKRTRMARAESNQRGAARTTQTAATLPHPAQPHDVLRELS